MRALGIIGGAALLGYLVAPAIAQSGWTFGGVAFSPRANWCVTHTTQDDIAAMEARPCGSEFPYMSVGVAASAAGQTWNLPNLAEEGAAVFAGPEGPRLMAEAIKANYGECVKSSLVVERDPVPGLSGWTIAATYSCTKDGVTTSTDFRNFTGYAAAPTGALWLVTFDYPSGSMTAEDQAMLKAAADRIAGR